MDMPVSSRRMSTGLLGLLLVAATGLTVAVVTTHVVTDRTLADARAQNHRALLQAAQANLDTALANLVSVPLSQRAPEVLPGAPNVGTEALKGEPGAVTVVTTLLRSTAHTAVAQVEVNSDGFSTTVVEKHTHTPAGVDASDVCSFGDMGGSRVDCIPLLTNVANSTN